MAFFNGLALAQLSCSRLAVGRTWVSGGPQQCLGTLGMAASLWVDRIMAAMEFSAPKHKPNLAYSGSAFPVSRMMS